MICFTRPIWNGGDCLHLVPPTPRRRLPCPTGLKPGTYTIWDGHGFRLPQSIQAVNKGNYELIILTEKNILDAVY